MGSLINLDKLKIFNFTRFREVNLGKYIKISKN